MEHTLSNALVRVALPSLLASKLLLAMRSGQ